MSSKRRNVLVVLAGLVFLPGAANAQLYRWVDQDGRTIVSDTPPPAGSKIKPQQIRKAGETTSVPPAPEKDAKAAAPEAKDKKAIDPAACAQARQMLTDIEAGRPLLVNDPKGQPTLMDAALREREAARLRGVLKDCS